MFDSTLFNTSPVYDETVAALGDPADAIHEIRMRTDPLYRCQELINSILRKLSEIMGIDLLTESLI